jgi:methionine-gamma-lyase
MNRKETVGFETSCIHAAGEYESEIGAISAPIYQTTTFGFPDVETAARRFSGEEKGYVYSRLRNPTTEAFEKVIARLESGESAVATASGMAAISMALLSVVRPGDRIVSSRTVYGGTHSLFEGMLKDLGISVSYVDGRDPESFEVASDPQVKVVYVESPANPNLCVVDLGRAAEVARECHALLMVDNTFATPYFQKPLTLGADVVVHSATKYIGGHGDAMGGIIVGSEDFTTSVRQGPLKQFGAL